MSALGVSLLLLVCYTYGGYPLLVALWARVAPRPSLRRTDFEPPVS
jgi:hypothetical protein